MENITLGIIVKAFGIKGEAKILSSSHFRKERYKKKQKMYLYSEQKKEYKEVSVEFYRQDGQFDIVKFEEFNSIDALTPYINYLVQMPKANISLKKNYYFYSDLIGCKVFEENNDSLGVVKKVEEYASYATLRVQNDGQKDILIPFVKAFIKKVDLDKKEIIIFHWEGLK